MLPNQLDQAEAAVENMGKMAVMLMEVFVQGGFTPEQAYAMTWHWWNKMLYPETTVIIDGQVKENENR